MSKKLPVAISVLSYFAAMFLLMGVVFAVHTEHADSWARAFGLLILAPVGFAVSATLLVLVVIDAIKECTDGRD